MDARAALNRSVSAGLHLARGTADRVVRLAGPPLGKVAGSVVARVRGSVPPTAPATFTPSKTPATPTPEPTQDAVPSPAVVARNIGPQRPAATPPKKRTKPESVPGAKLPPPRPSTS
jgi:hypothetical protein